MASSLFKYLVFASKQSLRRIRYRSNRRTQLKCLVVAALVVIYLAFLRHRSGKHAAEDTVAAEPEGVRCTTAPGIEDIFVAVRTGATEIRKKLPVHLTSHLRCVPSFAIFSDAEDNLFGHHVHDALHNISLETKAANSEFELYRKLNEKGIEKLTHEDLYETDAAVNNGHPSNRAWILDKWKFLPILESAWAMRPDAKWYVIMEPDTYIFWSNLVQYVSQFDHTQAHYIGAAMILDSLPFAHGGGGIIISREAMKRCVNHIAANRVELEDYTARHWAGDALVGQVMIEVGVPVRDNWPLQQIHSTSGADFARSKPKSMLCAPVLSYHHMSADDIWNIADFEQRFKDSKISNVLIHKHVFEWHVLPQITLLKRNWDNFAGENLESDSLQRPGMSQQRCFMACRSDPHCRQYSVENEVCRMSKHVHLGQSVVDEGRNIQSGWMRDRILHYFHRVIPPCEGPDDEAFKRY